MTWEQCRACRFSGTAYQVGAHEAMCRAVADARTAAAEQPVKLAASITRLPLSLPRPGDAPAPLRAMCRNCRRRMVVITASHFRRPWPPMCRRCRVIHAVAPVVALALAVAGTWLTVRALAVLAAWWVS